MSQHNQTSGIQGSGITSQSASAPGARLNQVVFVNNLSDAQAMELMDVVTRRAQERGISTQEYVRCWMCGDSL